MLRKLGLGFLLSFLCLLWLPAVVEAQSQITGQVKDESGAVLPGVTVEAASPVLIEKQKTVVTDDQGRYTVVDLRPGTYKVTFTLTGFSTVVRDGLELPSNFTATVNAALKVGGLEETITVSGATPLVDVQQAQKVQVLSRDVIDVLPTTRNVMSIGMLTPGVRLGIQDVGGSAALGQTSPKVHGVNQTESVQMVDGMSVQTMEDCVCQVYQDEALATEVTMTTSAIPAEVAAGGMRTNSIPKDGGNIISGAVFLGGSDGGWQSKNIDAALIARNVTAGDRISHTQNFNASMGGPILQDKLWYFMAGRHLAVDQFPAGIPSEYLVAPNGELTRAVADQHTRNFTARLTWQASQKAKFGVFAQRLWKEVGRTFANGADPRAAVQRDPKHANNVFGNAKWTVAATNKLLIEGGYDTVFQNSTIWPMVGTSASFITDRSNPLFYTAVQKSDTALNINPECAIAIGCTSWGSNSATRTNAEAKIWGASVSYVTGSHNLKVGFQHVHGIDDVITERNGDLIANYSNNRPSTVTVFNTPVNQKAHIKYDVGIFAQDSWTLKRLTVNPGVRWQAFNAYAPEVSLPAGQFAPGRFYAAQPNLPNFRDVAPRLSTAYDLFGNGKTAIKASAGRYYVQITGFWTKVYANSGLSSDTRTWLDCQLNAAGNACSGAAAPTDNDRIVQLNEIGPSSSSTFGLRSDRNPDPNIQRQNNWEYSTAVQQQLTSTLSVGAAWYHRSWRQLQVSDRTLISGADYTSFTTPMPSFANDPTLTGVLNPTDILTLYNLNASARSVFGSAIIDSTSSVDQSVYNGFEMTFSTRFQGVNLFGGFTADRNRAVYCSLNDDPNGAATADKYLGESVDNGGRFCDQRKYKIPFKRELKLAGNYPLPLGFDVAAVLQSYSGLARIISWTPAASLFPGGRTNSETIILNQPGSLYYPRYNQLDVNFKKNFRSGKKLFTVQVDFFNMLNSNAILTANNAIGSSLGQVTSVQLGRLPRIAFQMKF